MRIERERRQERLPAIVTGAKLVALVLASIILILYVSSNYYYDLFITTIVLILVLSLVSIIAPVALSSSKLRPGIKIGDMIFHGVAAIFVLLAASLLLDRVTKFSESVRHSHRTGQSFFSTYWVNVNDEALASGILALFLSLLHAIIVVIIWRKA